MTWLRNAWYQAGWSEEVKIGKPLVRTILGEQILIFRKADGSAAALLDMCPHRFAPLSAGNISGEVVTCGYHGLAFNAHGVCVHNPHGPVTSAMRVRNYPLIERHTALWLWAGEPDLADPDLIADLSFIDRTPEPARIAMYLPTKANYQLLVDNIMDLSHADYLHPETLGGIMTGAKSSTRDAGDHIVAEWISSDCIPAPAFVPMLPPGARADVWTEVVWRAPSLMVLGTSVVPTGTTKTPEDDSYTLHNMVPETETTTHYFACNTRRYRLDDDELSAMIRPILVKAFCEEDKPMLEKQQARMGTPDLWSLSPILLQVDAGAVRVRRKLDSLIAAERAAATSQPAHTRPLTGDVVQERVSGQVVD
ncbi:aromatic ring-hydroxylating dioxygenase subunit alpha [Aquisediminimonas profunda]|uniref:aromatic ring-hydroxylating dioxygenase subunit alpha n=1 Tax=Aquisediminimonas profunda TaxID=1550733 RepID=UPI001C638782|nr:aromatic ring-hydroxylating dioxygenase subunit alpha [Aquisediminimonas profunda]